jgi:crotonobetaine/carnitine-CoA ligase
MAERYLTVPEFVANAASRFGDRPALVTPRGQETFADLRAAVARAGGGIRRAGAAPGDRVLLVARNTPATVHAWLGAIHAGVVPAAVNPELTEAELQYLREDLDAAAVLRAEDLGALVEADPVPAHAADPLATAAIVYTSGTTSRPKGVQVRHAAYTETGRSFPGWIGLGARESLWACLPLFHINAQAYSLMTCLERGWPCALSERFHASTFWRDAAALGVTSVNVIGAMLTFLERQPAETWVESGLRTIYAAPAPAPDRRRDLEARFRVRITGGYGMSENTFGCAESPTSRDKPGSIGRPRQPASGAFVNELEIRGGELWFRNPLLTPGYWNAAEITAATIVDGWLRTGDAGRVDADGDVFLTGRVKDMIRRRGENIAPAEVEDALAAHPGVGAVAVFGVPSEVGEEEVVAAVVPNGERPDAEELRRFARERLAAFKLPSEIVFVDELPMTPTMRVAKDELRRSYLAGNLSAPRAPS